VGVGRYSGSLTGKSTFKGIKDRVVVVSRNLNSNQMEKIQRSLWKDQVTRRGLRASRDEGPGAKKGKAEGSMRT